MQNISMMIMNLYLIKKLSIVRKERSEIQSSSDGEEKHNAANRQATAMILAMVALTMSCGLPAGGGDNSCSTQGESESCPCAAGGSGRRTCGDDDLRPHPDQDPHEPQDQPHELDAVPASRVRNHEEAVARDVFRVVLTHGDVGDFELFEGWAKPHQLCPVASAAGDRENFHG